MTYGPPWLYPTGKVGLGLTQAYSTNIRLGCRGSRSARSHVWEPEVNQSLAASGDANRRRCLCVACTAKTLPSNVFILQ